MNARTQALLEVDAHAALHELQARYKIGNRDMIEVVLGIAQLFLYAHESEWLEYKTSDQIIAIEEAQRRRGTENGY